jgi:hypothetical protein
MKRCAVNCVLAFFGLADLDADRVKARVEELLKDHRYIFMVHPTTVRRDLSPIHVLILIRFRANSS